ncbi:MAG: Txe/YoeB family addiction module toxin [Flavobacterium sp.]
MIQPTAELDLSKHKKAGDVATIKKIIQILKELQEHPFSGSGKPEALKHNLTGLWSRRINKKDRLIYEVQDEIVTVFVVSAMGHDED